ncbi:MAG: hypothetical protein J6Y90_06455, partial [Lachnospiraceae bacterium]|nr:hypothetical protein [Lachnospiraceae bacterium]
MSECVVRMELRENCLDCDLHQIVYGDSYADIDVYCFKEKRFVGKRFGPAKDLARPDWCPIICSLPEGHGRLVDADALHKIAWPVKDHTGRIEECVQMRDLYKAPTIVPAER